MDTHIGHRINGFPSVYILFVVRCLNFVTPLTSRKLVCVLSSKYGRGDPRGGPLAGRRGLRAVRAARSRGLSAAGRGARLKYAAADRMHHSSGSKGDVFNNRGRRPYWSLGVCWEPSC